MATSSEAASTADIDTEDYRSKCGHYRRGCSFVAPCCGKVYPCRLCHDDKELSHQINRHAVSEVVCRKCSKRQPVGERCVKCGIQFGRYFCPVCRLYDDADKRQFHCDKCGLCRVGGRDNFYHCDTCGLCLPLATRNLHTCRQEMSKNNCPVCMEDIHTSRTPAHMPRCGHLIHTTCYEDLVRNGLYQCPQCQTSLADMSSHWRVLDIEKESWQLPQHLATFKVKVSCRDCHKESDTLFHVVGLKCGECGSYNTVRCGSEEIPQDEARGGAMNLVHRVGGAPQEGDQDTDSSSSDESGGSDDSDPDEDRGNNGPGGPAHHGNHHPDSEDRGHHHDDNFGEPDGASPGNQARDDGSYDGDESDSSEEFTSDSGDFFFDCVNRVQRNSPMSQRQRQQRRQSSQPIRLQTPESADAPEWWESDEERGSTSHSCNHSNTRKPHPPVQVMVERLQVIEIWGSDYYTDSFSEVTSGSCAEEEAGHLEESSLKCADSVPVLVRGESQSPPGSLTRLYSEVPSIMYPIQNGLNSRSTNAHTYPVQNGPAAGNGNQTCTHHPCPVQNGLNTSPTRNGTWTGLVSELNDPLCGGRGSDPWVRKSSSEESWFTANEDLELGTLV